MTFAVHPSIKTLYNSLRRTCDQRYAPAVMRSILQQIPLSLQPLSMFSLMIHCVVPGRNSSIVQIRRQIRFHLKLLQFLRDPQHLHPATDVCHRRRIRSAGLHSHLRWYTKIFFGSAFSALPGWIPSHGNGRYPVYTSRLGSPTSSTTSYAVWN